MKPITVNDLLALPVADRLRLVEDLWDSIAEVPESVNLTDAQRAELDRRLEAYHQDPASGSPWNEVKERIQKQG
jgi:putative addiction module component (TIGR02574 family)